MRSVLGKVAKGAKRFGEHVVGEAQKVAEEVNQTDSEVEALLQRLSGASMHPEYRREAVVQLKDMLADNPKAQLAFGSMGGVPLMISVLQDDRDDVGLLRGALECCVHAMRPPPSAPAPPAHSLYTPLSPAGTPWGNPAAAQGAAAQGGQVNGHGQNASYQQLLVPHPEGPSPHAAMQSLESQAAAINAELLARRPDNVLLLLALLEDEPVGINDFYVRYHTVQLLTVLLQTCAYKLQDAILSSRGVVRLMDMLAEKEVIRNEALVLLVSLTHSNEEVQKIAAFEGAFDRVFHIVREEGGADGGVVVQDCLELLNNLLRANEANQRLFREMGYLSQLSQLLAAAVPAEGLPLENTALQHFNADRDEGIPISHQKAAILLCALETVMLLVAPPARSAASETQAASQGSSQANAAALLKHGMVEALLPLGLKHGGVASPAVSSQALNALGGIVLGSQAAGREKLGTSVVPLKPGSPPIPVLQAALRAALHSPDQSKRAAAEHLIHSFCSGNPEGQAALASTMTPTARGVTGVPATFGGELSAALKLGAVPGTSVEVGCRAASVLQHLLAGNLAVKERLLQLPVEVPLLPGAAPEFLLPRCLRLLSNTLQKKEPSNPTPTVHVLRLLIVWMRDCPHAIAHMMGHAGHLPLIVDVLTGRQGGDSVHVQGLAAVLLGVCLIHGSTSVQPQQQGQQQNFASQAQASPSELVLDTLISRVGLSQFIAKLDALCADAAFVSASSASNLPHRVTRAVAAAATRGDSTGADRHKQSQLSQPSPQSLGSSGAPIDHTFACLIHELDAEIRQHVLHAFARPRAAGSKHVAASSPTELIASLPGFGDAQKLHTAANTLLQLGRAADELRAQNQALAEDMARLAQQQQQQPLQGSPQQLHAAQGDADAITGAEQRASVAEAEVAAMRQHAELLAARLAQAEQDAAAAQEASANSFSHATKREEDLNTLGQHCHALESQIRELQHLLAEAQIQLQQQAQAHQLHGGAAGGVPEAEVARRVEEAVAKATADADANNEEQLTDLLVCLGQEEQKVSALSEKLAGYGVDVNALLESVKLEAEGEQDELQ